MSTRQLVIYYQNHSNKKVIAVFVDNKHKIEYDNVFEYQDIEPSIIAADISAIGSHLNTKIDKNIKVIIDSKNSITYQTRMPKMSNSNAKKKIYKELSETFLNIADYEVDIKITVIEKMFLDVYCKLILKVEMNEITKIVSDLKRNINEIHFKEDIIKKSFNKTNSIFIDVADNNYKIGMKINEYFKIMNIDNLDATSFNLCFNAFIDQTKISDETFNELSFFIIMSEDIDKEQENEDILKGTQYEWLRVYPWKAISNEAILFKGVVHEYNK